LIAVVTATRDSLETVKKCVQAIKEHTVSDHIHIVSDDSSQLETLSYLRNLNHIHLIETQGDNNPHLPLVLRKAFVEAYNRNVKYILMVESDVYVTPEWDIKLIKSLESKPNAAGVTATTINNDKKMCHPSSYDVPRIYRQKWAVGMYKDEVVLMQKHLHFSCTIFKVEACKKVDFIHEDRVGGVDVRFSGELRKNGYELYADLSTYVYHPRPHSSRNEWKRRVGRVPRKNPRQTRVEIRK
jgi:GT2 family glycosyltransferase